MLLKKGKEHYEQGRYEAALELLTKAIGHLLNPPKAKTKKFLGIEVTTRDSVSRLVGKYPDDSLLTAYMIRGSVYHNLGRDKDALDDVDAALQLADQKIDQMRFFPAKKDITLANIHLMRGAANAKLEHWDDALTDFDRAAQHGELPLQVHLDRVKILIKLKRWDDALAGCTQLLELAQEDSKLVEDNLPARIHSIRSGVYAEQGQWENALSECDRAIVLDNDHCETVIFRLCLLVGLKRWTDLLNNYDHAVKMVETSKDLSDEKREELLSRVKNCRGIALSQVGQYDDALISFNEAEKHNPEKARVFINRGYTYVALGNYTQALEEFGTAREKSEDLARAIVGEAICHHATKDIAKAQTLWRTLLEKYTRYGDLDWIRDQVWEPTALAVIEKIIASMGDEG